MYNLQNKNTLVIGGTNGIGLAVAKTFAHLGANVIVVARKKPELTTFKPFSIEFYQGDVLDQHGITNLVQCIQNKWGKLHVLVNNVGTNFRKNLVAISQEEYRQLFELNVFSVMHSVRSFFPLLQQANGASVVNMASVAGSIDVNTGATYGMSKAALIQLTKHLAVEWAVHNIRVNAVSPWYTNTQRIAPILQTDKTLEEKILNRTPLHRIASPQDVANAVAFLAMDKAGYITGQNLTVDGGLTANGL